jgi:hypothetical protein
MTYIYRLLVLALDRRIIDISLEERLQSQTYALFTWAKAMLPTIKASARLKHNFAPVVMTSVLISLTRRLQEEEQIT